MKQNLIGISGKMGSGKDTVGAMIVKRHPQFVIKAFAHKLKVIASILSGIPVESFYDQDFKTQDMPEIWSKRIKANTGPGKGNILHESSTSVRKFLQKIGTDALRTGLHPEVWVNALFADYNPLLSAQAVILDMKEGTTEPVGKPVSGEYPYWIITDVRFPNEAEAIKEHGGILIRVNRDVESRIHADHASETALDTWEDWDHIINNNGTITGLKAKVTNIMKTYEH